VFLLSYRNTSGSLGEREMLWEHEPKNLEFQVFIFEGSILLVFVKKEGKKADT